MTDLEVAGAAPGPSRVTIDPGTLVDHARRELDLCGQFAEDPAFSASLVAAIAAFTSYGHSGGSATEAIAQLEVLLRRGTLSELTSDPAEWIDLSEQSGYPMWQSARCPAAFSDDGGVTFWLLPNRDGMTGRPRIPRGTRPVVRSGRRFYPSAQPVQPVSAGPPAVLPAVCDWGFCERSSIGWRRSVEFGWLPVCDVCLVKPEPATQRGQDGGHGR